MRPSSGTAIGAILETGSLTSIRLCVTIKARLRTGSARRILFTSTVSDQWYHSADTLSWQALGKGGLNAAFVGDQRWHDLGNGWDYQFSYRYHKGTFEDGYAWFLYKYHKNQWWHSSQTLLENGMPLSVEGVTSQLRGGPTLARSRKRIRLPILSWIPQRHFQRLYGGILIQVSSEPVVASEPVVV